MAKVITFGELMIRLQPYNYERFVQADHLEFSFGSGVANVAVSLAHVGVNCANEGEAEQTAKTLCALFGLEYKAGSSSIFAGSAVECMKAPYLGKNGHIAIATNNLDRAVYHLGRQGVEFDESTRKPKAIYLKGEVGGFAIHLVQK